MAETYDIVIVGSGINSLVCAAELSLKGRKVLVLERAETAGGCIRTEEVTLPGYRHDIFSMSYPLFVTTPFYPMLKPHLDREGVRMVSAKFPTGVLLPDGRSLLLRQDRAANVARFDSEAIGDGQAHARAMTSIERASPLLFGLLGNEPKSLASLGLALREGLTRGWNGTSAIAADALEPLRSWVERDFSSELLAALIAPWVLHVGLGPDSAFSAMMGKIVLFTLEAAGLPFVEGGGARLVEAFTRIITTHGGAIRTSSDVASVIVERGRARGVVLETGESVHAGRAVVCNTTPTQLYKRLLADVPIDGLTRSGADRYRYGRADMQIHIALKEPPRWPSPELAQVGLLHLTAGLNAVSKAVNEADRGLLPTNPTIVVGQPADADPSRCPPGASLLWIQLQELPRIVTGDAAGEIAPPADGRWNDDIARNYARRVLDELRRHITNFDDAVLDIHVMGPHVLESFNINLVGGDPYSGVCSLDQFHFLRPFSGNRGHATPVRGLYHIGASTHPGPGLSGTSGHMAAAAIG
ncbi:MAG: FAD-dependent oxidoreductase [Sphingomonas sp.]|nr:MAG: FAD-dependent oxidoreductase [Sphingomonas sp.]